ncbi:MAG: cell division protein FtsA [Candidatus Omnitrophica bacterium]|nr:cell division protein FtsA [Candidatus Omnitrophota bacterium]
MLKDLFKEKVFCGLDIGTKAIKAALIKIEPSNQKEVLGFSDHKTFGIRDSSVSDLSEFSDCVHSVLDDLSKKSKTRFKLINLGIGCEHIQVRKATSVMPLLDKQGKIISSRDVQDVNENAHLIGVKLEEEVLHTLPEYYLINDDNIAVNPIGLHAKKLGVSCLLVVAKVNFLRNISRAVNQAGYEVGKIYFNSFAAGEAVLSAEDKKAGCLLIDIGSKITTVMFYKDGVLKHLHKIDKGGNAFTEDIAEKLALNLELAEEIKKTYAIASSSEKYNEEEILIKRENNYFPIKRELIYRSIEGEIIALVSGIKEFILESGILSEIANGIVFIGGGSLLPGLIEKIGAETKLQVRLGKALGVTYKNPYRGPLYSASIGLAFGPISRSTAPANISSSSRPNIFLQAVNKVKDLYFEYF